MKPTLKYFTFLLIFSGIIPLINSCKNKPGLITVSTVEVKDIKQSSAVSGGSVEAEKNISVTSRGICWSTSAIPSIGNKLDINGKGAGDFSSIMTGLRPGTTYYVRAYAISITDTSYGEVLSFTTENYGIVEDIDANEYNTIAIGKQTWMAKNLGTTKLNDGTIIHMVNDSAGWASLSSPAYCWYNNDEATFKTGYGALYNGYTVNSGKLCPEGWHVPTDAEWDVLATFLGGEDVAGGKLKEAGTSRWVRPNNGGTNASNFTALPGGLRYSDGVYHDYGFGGYWWSSTQYSASRAFFRFLYYQDSCIYRFDNLKTNGFSIRCLRDN